MFSYTSGDPLGNMNQLGPEGMGTCAHFSSGTIALPGMFVATFQQNDDLCQKRACQIRCVKRERLHPAGDNKETAGFIAHECGIYTPGGVVMEGAVFRSLSEEERLACLPTLQVRIVSLETA